MMEQVILVDAQDRQVGSMEKMEAHLKGELHRAFSIFIFNNNNEMLLQQRAITKYHSGGLWTNACCSHPRPNEETIDAADRRLQEELGFATPLTKIFDFQYNASFDNGLIEHEFDHVFIGYYGGNITPNPEEVQEVCYMSIEDILASVQSEPNIYTAWFCIAFPKVVEWIAHSKNNHQ